MLVLSIKSFLEDLGDKIYDLVGNYSSSPVFWVVTALLLFLICCWAINYFGKK